MGVLIGKQLHGVRGDNRVPPLYPVGHAIPRRTTVRPVTHVYAAVVAGVQPVPVFPPVRHAVAVGIRKSGIGTNGALANVGANTAAVLVFVKVAPAVIPAIVGGNRDAVAVQQPVSVGIYPGRVYSIVVLGIVGDAVAIDVTARGYNVGSIQIQVGEAGCPAIRDHKRVSAVEYICGCRGQIR